MGMCCKKKTMDDGARRQDVDQRKLGREIVEKAVTHVN